MRADDFIPKDFLSPVHLPVVDVKGTIESEQKIDDELIKICGNESITPNEFEGFLHQLMNITEKQILLGSSISNHLTVLNRQLRQAAAVFLLVVSGSILMSCAGGAAIDTGANNHSGPYELALGNKIVP